MVLLKDKDLVEINGGGVKKGLLIGLAALGALVAGIIDGLLRPLKCRS
ncbi:MAG: class IIb bacteriocin, lactobin A/cerein 7B family [Bacilli bacterium]|nr:class IIb bacteriocin, lactobin A/cerein 7B family [Bacilli bacterium]